MAASELLVPTVAEKQSFEAAREKLDRERGQLLPALSLRLESFRSRRGPDFGPLYEAEEMAISTGAQNITATAMRWGEYTPYAVGGSFEVQMQLSGGEGSRTVERTLKHDSPPEHWFYWFRGLSQDQKLRAVPEIPVLLYGASYSRMLGLAACLVALEDWRIVDEHSVYCYRVGCREVGCKWAGTGAATKTTKLTVRPDPYSCSHDLTTRVSLADGSKVWETCDECGTWLEGEEDY